MFFSAAIRVKCGIPERDTRQHSFLKLQKSNLSFGFAIMNLSEADRLSQIQFSIGESDRGRSLYPLSSGSDDRRKNVRTDRSCRRQSQRRPDPHSGDRRQLLYGYGVCSPGVPPGDAPSSSAGSLCRRPTTPLRTVSFALGITPLQRRWSTFWSAKCRLGRRRTKGGKHSSKQ